LLESLTFIKSRYKNYWVINPGINAGVT